MAAISGDGTRRPFSIRDSALPHRDRPWGVLCYAFPVLAADITADIGWSTPTITAARYVAATRARDELVVLQRED